MTFFYGSFIEGKLPNFLPPINSQEQPCFIEIRMGGIHFSGYQLSSHRHHDDGKTIHRLDGSSSCRIRILL